MFTGQPTGSDVGSTRRVLPEKGGRPQGWTPREGQGPLLKSRVNAPMQSWEGSLGFFSQLLRPLAALA
jgi:hypothetical protein